MTGYDEPILELLEDSGVALPPRGIEINLHLIGIEVSNTTVHNRIKRLHENGLVDKVVDDAGYYALSEKGRAYLEGDLDVDELED